MSAMLKRKRELPTNVSHGASDGVAKPAPGTRVFTSGKAVKIGLAPGSRQALVAFHQQILTPHSKLPLPIHDQTVVILQHYLDVSPLCDEIFDAWNEGDKRREEKQVEAAILLLAHILRILTPIPFFRSALVDIVNKLTAPQERYHELICRLITSGSREGMLAGLSLASAAINVDKPDPSSSSSSSSTGRAALKVWSTLLEGGAVKVFGKLMIMRKRKKDGSADYGDKDPMDRPDIRHLCLDLILPLVSTPPFHSHARQIMRPLFANIAQDPPITILRILTSLWEAITGPHSGAGRKNALMLLDEQAIDHLSALFTSGEVEQGSGKSVGEMTLAFVEGVTTRPGRGVCFADEGWYPRRQQEGAVGRSQGRNDDGDDEVHLTLEERTRRGLHNRILSNVVRKLGGKVLEDSGRISSWAIHMLEACPELVSGYWSHSALAVEPRLNARWIATMAYIGDIVSLPPPALSTFRVTLPRGSSLETPPFRSEPPDVGVIIESILPSPLTKTHTTKGLSHADHLVQLVTAQTVARCLQKLLVVQKLLRTIEAEVTLQPGTSLENPWSSCLRQLELEARRRIPELMVIIAFAQKSATLGQANEDDEVDPALASKSAMLTEAALRLFGLYHSAVPAITRDTKFDVGRLLVSSSSVKQERRERKEAKANGGSVVDETMTQGSSIGSMGSAGTAGMGGGFGYAKGDVQGFEALSQVHVLQLLGSVEGWQWSNKASGSQYTYLYHILQLHLATHQASSTAHTTALLRHLLIPTKMFDHDPSELDLWLSALPRLPSEAGALGIIQQVHFLSFFDDCVRRCLKLPYRYLDDTNALIPGYLDARKLHAFPSILLMAMLEQWCAKVAGSHISSEAAGVVARVMGRLLLGLVGKFGDTRFVVAYVERMEMTLSQVREEGKAKEGLEGVVHDIKKMVALDVTGTGSVDTEIKMPDLLDEREWRESSFEHTALYAQTIDTNIQSKLDGLIRSATAGTQGRYARFATHLLPLRVGDQQILLGLVRTGLELCSDSTEVTRAKDAVFDNAWIKDALTSASGDGLRNELDLLIGVLDESVPADQLTADQYVIGIEQGVVSDKKGKRIVGTLDLASPWARFLSSDRARSILLKLGQHPDRLVGERKGKAFELSPRVKSTIAVILQHTQHAETALKNLDLWIDLSIVKPVIGLVEQATVLREFNPASVDITTEAIVKVTSTTVDEAGELLHALVSAYPSAAKSFAKVISTNQALLKRVDLIPAINAVLSLPGGIESDEVKQDVVATAFEAMESSSTSVREAAVDILAGIVHGLPNLAVPTIGKFSIAHAHLLGRLIVETSYGVLDPVTRGIAEAGLKYVVRVSASLTPLSVDQVAVMVALRRAIAGQVDLRLDGILAESAISAITQDRLGDGEAVLFAAELVLRSELKASFIRQQLSALTSSKRINQLSSPSIPPSERLPFTRLYSALFHSSTYTSCQPNYIEPLLPLYSASLHITDRLILGMWQTFESVRHLSVASIIAHWSATGARPGSGGGAGRAFDALMGMDASRMMATCTVFPLRRSLAVQDPQERGEEWGAREEKAYDPVFVLSLLGALLSGASTGSTGSAGEPAYEMSGLDWVEIIRSDALGVVVCALAARNEGLRRLAGYVLGRMIVMCQKVTFHERDQLLHVFLLLQHAIPSPAESTVTNTTPIALALAPPRLPTLTTLFLAHHLHSIGSPSHFLYPITSRFLLQRPTLDLYDPPMLYSLLYGSDRGPRGELPSMAEVRRGKGWILRLLRDGVRSEADWSLCRRRNVWSLLATMFGASIDVPFRRLVLQTMDSMALIPQAARTLVYKYNIISWCKMHFDLSLAQSQTNARGGAKGGGAAAEERERLVRLVELCVRGCVDGELRKGDAVEIAVSGANGDVHGDGVVEEEEESDSDDSEDGAGGGGDDDDDEAKKAIEPAVEGKKKWPLFDLLLAQPVRKEWIVSVESFLRRVVQDADHSRLEILSRILLALSSISKESVAILLPIFVDRLIGLSKPAPTGSLVTRPTSSNAAHTEHGENIEHAEHEQKTLEYFFRAGLVLGDKEKMVLGAGSEIVPARVRWALGEVEWRVGGLAVGGVEGRGGGEGSGDVGLWVREERRRVAWEARVRGGE